MKIRTLSPTDSLVSEKINLLLRLLIENVVERFNKSTNITATASDLTKAFDCVDHNILVQKLDYYGVRGVFSKC